MMVDAVKTAAMVLIILFALRMLEIKYQGTKFGSALAFIH